MNSIHRLDTQTGRQIAMTVRSGQRLTLATGELLKLEMAGVQSLRQGADLVLLVPSDHGGAPVRVVVAQFFASGSMGMVQLGADGQTELLTSQSSVPTASQSQANGFSELEQSDTDTSSAMVMRDAGLISLSGQPHDLRIADTQGLKTEVVKKQLEIMHLRNTSAAFSGHIEINDAVDAIIDIKWVNGTAIAHLKADLQTNRFTIEHSENGMTSIMSF